MKKNILYIVTGLLAFSTIAISQTEWTIDPVHSNIRFAVRHMGISQVEGKFNEYEGKVITESEGFVGAKVSFSAKTASVDTDNERRDGHLKSDDFFNAEMYPDLKYEGTIVKEGDVLVLVGNLTIRDVTKEIKFAVSHGGTIDGRKGPVAGFKLTGSINRFDYNLKFDRAMPGGDLLVGKNIDITFNLELLGPEREEDAKEK